MLRSACRRRRISLRDRQFRGGRQHKSCTADHSSISASKCGAMDPSTNAVSKPLACSYVCCTIKSPRAYYDSQEFRPAAVGPHLMPPPVARSHVAEEIQSVAGLRLSLNDAQNGSLLPSAGLDLCQVEMDHSLYTLRQPPTEALQSDNCDAEAAILRSRELLS